MKRKRIHIILFLAIAALLLWSQGDVPAKSAAVKELYWHSRLSIAKKFAGKSGKPILAFVHISWDIPSWEAEQAVLKSDRFAEHARAFVLCRTNARSETLKKAAGRSSADLGGIIFFDKNLKELERIRWQGDPEAMLDAIARVAAGKNIKALRAGIKKNPKDIESLETLYGIYSRRVDAAAVETLEKILEADPDRANAYEGHKTFWELLSSASRAKADEAVQLIERDMHRVKDARQRDLLKVQVALLLSRTGKKDEAVRELKEFIAGNPSSDALEQAYEELMRLLIIRGDEGEALMAGAKMIKKFPRNSYMLNFLRATAGKHYALKKYPEAAALLKIIAAGSPATGKGIEAEFLHAAMTRGTQMKQRAAEKRPVLDVLYVVPDVPTFLEYISRWDEKHIFPVLINEGTKQDERLIKKFAAEFKPSKIVEVKDCVKQELNHEFVRRAVLASWDERIWSDVKDSGPEAFKKFYESKKLSPLGIVFVDTTSPDLLAGGVALAAGHRQLIDFYGSGLKASTDVTRKIAVSIRASVHKKIAAWGYDYLGHFDDIEFVTFASSIPLRYKGMDYLYYSTDDYIIRRDDDVRFAYSGRLVEGVSSADYMAMCALFLQPDKALFFDGYGTKGGGFASYRTAAAAAQMKKLMPTVNVDGRRATLATWKKMESKVNPYGFVYVNSSGTKDHWWVAGKKAKPTDIPSESAPAIVHMTHSFSAQRAYDSSTVAGRWIFSGAYIYYGSTEEPFLESFRRPSELVTSILEGEPLGMTFRRRIGRAYWRKWRLCYFGDPVYVLTGKNTERLSAAGLKLSANETEREDIDKLFGE